MTRVSQKKLGIAAHPVNLSPRRHLYILIISVKYNFLYIGIPLTSEWNISVHLIGSITTNVLIHNLYSVILKPFLLYFLVESELSSEESPCKDVSNNIDSTLTNHKSETSSGRNHLHHQLADAVVDSGVDSETTPSSPEDAIMIAHKEASSNNATKQKVDSDVMETAEMLLSLSGNNNSAKTNIMGSNTALTGGIAGLNMSSIAGQGLKDEFIKSLRLQKKEKLKVTSLQQQPTDKENSKTTGRNLRYIRSYFICQHKCQGTYALVYVF